MKTRIIKTRYWVDSTVHSLSKNSRYLFLYLLTSPHINLCGIFELPDEYICIDTGLNAKEVQKAKEELIACGKAIFRLSWVYIKNADKHNGYRNSPSNEIAYTRELKSIPAEIKLYFDSTVDSTVHSTYKQEVINKNTKVINKKEEIGKENEDRGKAFLARWNEAHKTKYTAWKPISENLEYWLEQYTPEQILQAVKNLALDDFWKDKMTPTIFLRQKNRHGEAVDYIGQLSQKKRRAVVGL